MSVCPLVRSPLGLLLLEHYCKVVTKCVNLDVDLENVQELEEGIAALLQDLQRRNEWKEKELTEGLKDVLIKFHDHTGSLSSLCFEAECRVNDVQVYDWEQKTKVKRNARADIVFAKVRVPPAPQVNGTTATTGTTGTASTSADTSDTSDTTTTSNTTNTTNSPGSQAKENDTLNVRHEDIVGILEASLDNNGGLRKAAQGLDYAVMFGGKEKFSGQRYRVVWTLHVNRVPRQEETTTTGSTSNTRTATTDATATARTSTCTESTTHTIVETTTPEDPSIGASAGVGDDENDNGGDVVTTTSDSNANANTIANVDTNGKGKDKQSQAEKVDKPPRTIIEDMEVRVYLCELSWNEKEGCAQSRYSLVWRDFVGGKNQVENCQLIKEGSHFIVLAVAMVLKLVDLLDNYEEKVNERFPDWTLKGPNCARSSCTTSTTTSSSPAETVESHSDTYRCMYKVFDNRMSPTARSPYMWVDERLCDELLNVEPFLFFHEGHLVLARGGSSHSNSDSRSRSHPFVYFNGDTTQTVADVKRAIQDLSEDGRGQVKNVSNSMGGSSGSSGSIGVGGGNDSGSDRGREEGSGGAGVDLASTSEVVERRLQTQTPFQPLLGNSRPIISGPARKGQKGRGDEKPSIPFGQGTIVVLRYKYAAGQHWPSGTVRGRNGLSTTSTVSPHGSPTTRARAGVGAGMGIGGSSGASPTLGSPRSFLPILHRLKLIHKGFEEDGKQRSFVHGDVRLYNMIFGSVDSSDGSKSDNAFLLDYDLGGQEGLRKYPPLYAEWLPDIFKKRAGEQKEPLSFRHDLGDLIGVLRLFDLKSKLIDDLTQEERDLRDRKDKLTDEERDLRDRKDKLTKEERDLRDRKDELRDRKDELRDRKDELRDHSIELSGVALDEEKVKTALKDIQSAIAQKEAELKELNDELNELNYKNRKASLEEDLRQVRDLVVNWKKDLKELNDKLVKNDPEISMEDAHEQLEALLTYDVKIRGNLSDPESDPNLYLVAGENTPSFVTSNPRSVEVGTGSPDRANTKDMGREPKGVPKANNSSMKGGASTSGLLDSIKEET